MVIRLCLLYVDGSSGAVSINLVIAHSRGTCEVLCTIGNSPDSVSLKILRSPFSFILYT
jgi:hypothetical protein